MKDLLKDDTDAVLLDKAAIGSDISFKNIEELCNLVVYETTNKNEVSERIADCDIVITNKVVIGKNELDSAKKLKLICVAATGYNNIDISEARKRNIVVANVKGYSTESVAQTVFGYMLAISNSMANVAHDIKKKLWQSSSVFTMLNHPFIELKGKNLGIIGYGTIGERVAEIAKAFKMNVLISESFHKSKQDHNRSALKDLLKQSDIISIHTPLTEKTRNLISKNEFALMKSSAILINTARGGIVNEQDLYDALMNKEIKYAATDVLSKEPPAEGNILFDAPNLMITPHTAWTSIESRKKLIRGIAFNIKKFKDDETENIDLCMM